MTTYLTKIPKEVIELSQTLPQSGEEIVELYQWFRYQLELTFNDFTDNEFEIFKEIIRSSSLISQAALLSFDFVAKEMLHFIVKSINNRG
jgi:hypothetical protein